MWFPFSLAYAFFDSVQNAYYKKAAVQIPPILMAWSVLVISGLCFSPLLFIFEIPELNRIFWISVFARLIIDSVAFTLFITGVQKSPLSLTIPMTCVSPILSIFTVFLLSGLLPSAIGGVGVVITMAGLYLLNFDHDTKHLLSPFKAVFREKGVLYVTIASILWSIVSALQKLAIDNSSVYFYTAFFQIFWAVCFTPVAYFSNPKYFRELFRSKSIKQLLPGGIIDAIKTIFQNVAYVFAIPAYVNTVGNTSILISTLFGVVFFKEKLEKKIFATLIVFIGITLIALS